MVLHQILLYKMDVKGNIQERNLNENLVPRFYKVTRSLAKSVAAYHCQHLSTMHGFYKFEMTAEQRFGFSTYKKVELRQTYYSIKNIMKQSTYKSFLHLQK